MPQDRYFTAEELFVHQQVELSEEEAFHLSVVMRHSTGDCVELVNGRGVCAKAIVEEKSKQSARLSILSCRRESLSLPHIVLIQPLLPLSSLSQVVEKSVELGVGEICLFPSERGKCISMGKREWRRLQQKAIAAMKQCGRLDLPALSLLPPIREWKERGESFSRPLFYGEVQAKSSFLDWMQEREEVLSSLSFVVGSQKGFSQEEIRELSGQGEAICWNPHTLRAETAPIAFLAFLAAWLPHSSPPRVFS